MSFLRNLFGNTRQSQARGAIDSPPIPPEFADDIREVQDAEQRYLRTGDQTTLDAAAFAWGRILDAPSFIAADKRFQSIALNDAGITFLRRYQAGGRVDDLNHALVCWQRALAEMPSGSQEFHRYLSNLGSGLLARFEQSGRLDDLQEAIRVLQQAVPETPTGSSELSMCLNNLGAGLIKRFGQTGNLDDLQEAIKVFRQAVAETPAKSPEAPTRLNNLALGLYERFGQSGRPDDLEEAVGILRRAVAETPTGSLDLLKHLSNLALGLRDRFGHTGRQDDLDEAIAILRRAVAETPAGSLELPKFINNLGGGLRERFGHTGRPDDLEEAIRFCRQAVTKTPVSSPDLRIYLNSLGNGLSDRFDQTGRLDDLEEAIRFYRQAVTKTPVSSPDLRIYLNNLGGDLWKHFGRTGKSDDLEEAIAIFRRVVAETPKGSPEMPRYLNSLGLGLRERFWQAGQLDDLDEAVWVFGRAVAQMPMGSPELPSCLHNLSLGLIERFWETGRLDDLEEAIRVSQRAVVETPTGSPGLPARLSNLGNELGERFGRTGRLDDLEEAIRVHRLAIAETPANSPELPRRLSSLGWALSDRFVHIGQRDDLEEAIQIFRRAVAETPPSSPSLPGCLNALGGGLWTLFVQTGQLDDLEEAIQVLRSAVAETPAGSPYLPMCLANLGLGLRDRFGQTGQLEDLEEAIMVSNRAVVETPVSSPRLPVHLNILGLGLHDRFGQIGRVEDLEEAIGCFRRACELGAISAPNTVLKSSGNWGRWAFQRKQWAETAQAYDYGLATGRQVLGRQLLRMQKESALRDLQEISGPAAYALAKLDRFDEAVTTVERGRARLLADALERNRRDLEQLSVLGYADLYQRYREVVVTQEQLTRPAILGRDQPDHLSSQARLDAIIDANAAFDQVVAEIQRLPGYEDFLAEPTFAQIRAAAREGPLVYLLATSVGGLALIVDAHSVWPVWLAELTDATVRECLYGLGGDPNPNGWLSAYKRCMNERTDEAQTAWRAALDDIAKRLWSYVEPLVEALQRVLPIDVSPELEVTLIPSNLLALLPWHMAWMKDPSTPTGRRYFLDEVTVRYAPSAIALRHAREAARRAHVERLLAVEDPLTARPMSLPNAHTEVEAIADLFDRPVILAGAAATHQAVRAALPQAEVVHFSCHAQNDWQSPLDSGLLMADDETAKEVMLTVRNLLEMKGAGGRLATLAACGTGIVGTEQPDEVVMLPTALLQAGFSGVVASLWSVPDISTAMLMERFYRLWREENLPPAQALRAAQRWLRDTTNGEKAGYFERYSPVLAVSRMPEAVAIELYSEVMSRDLERRDFEHPYWWAAFYLTGV